MKTKFEEFINEQCTLTIEDSMDDFEIPEVKWIAEYNISDIWNQYKKDDNFNSFIKKYKESLLNKKNEIVKISKKCWNDLVKLIKENPTDNKLAYLDKIYDWGDKYGVKITTK